MCKRRTLFAGMLLGILTLVDTSHARAATVFGTLFENPGTLVRIDTASGSVTPIHATGASPDSIVFDSSGRMIYTLFGADQVRRFDPSNGTDVVIRGGFSGPLDLVLEPGGGTVLVSNNTVPRIDRLDLTTGVATPFLSTGGGGGLAYDASGRLFANLPGRVAELNPVTAAVLQSTPGVLDFDGLAFDPTTGNLFATDGSGGHVFRLDQNDLAAGPQLVATLAPSGGFADGIVADGFGHLFVAVRNLANESLSGLFQVDAVSGSFSQVALAAFLDDVAPLAGLGAPPPTASISTAPVPALSDTLLVVLTAALALVAMGHLATAKR